MLASSSCSAASLPNAPSQRETSHSGMEYATLSCGAPSVGWATGTRSVPASRWRCALRSSAFTSPAALALPSARVAVTAASTAAWGAVPLWSSSNRATRRTLRTVSSSFGSDGSRPAMTASRFSLHTVVPVTRRVTRRESESVAPPRCRSEV